MSKLLEARALMVVLPGDAGDVRVLDGVSFEVARGEIVDVVGPSGSGKSTFLRALARLLPGATGTLLHDGVPAESIGPQQWRASVALLPQKPVLVTGTVRDNLLLPWRFAARRGTIAPGDTKLAEGLTRLGVDAALDRDAARLSVGQAARVAFLRTMLTAPSVLLLDEPDAALDDIAADEVAALIAEFASAPAAPAGGGGAGAVVRVRHHRSDGLATRRMRLEHGHLTAEETSR